MSTAIEWTDETWNPVTGCSKVSQGCKHCYAERLWPKVSAAEAKRTGEPARCFTDVRTHPERLDQPLRWRKPKRVFVNSMSDLFHEDVPDEFLLQVFDVMRQCANGYASELDRLVPWHTFQVLTKRPARMLDFCGRLRHGNLDGRGLYLAETATDKGFNPARALRNVWLGVSVEDQATADERIPLLRKTPAAVRFLSCEPLLGEIDLRVPLNLMWHARTPYNAKTGEFGKTIGGWNNSYKIDDPHQTPLRSEIDWVIAGGESGPKARPSHPDWFRLLRDQCEAAGVPFFFKQWGEWRATRPEEEKPLLHRGSHEWNGGICAWKIGKGAAGRVLDGVTHDAYPQVAA